jgi:Xaa-Pro aminopeptidase
MTNRISQVQATLNEHDAGAVLVTHLPNIRWACGFTGSNGVLIVGPEEAHFVTDGRYDTQAHQEVEGAEIHVYDDSMWTYVEDAGLLDGYDRIAFQSDHVTVQRLNALEKRFEEVQWVPVAGLLSQQVAVKDDEEVERIVRAQRVTEAVLQEIVDRIEPGRTEREIAADIVHAHLRRGAEKMSFDPIVASGPNAALPHARPTDRVLHPGDLVVLDMGGFVDGYASDMTRTVSVGEPGERQRQVHEAVRRAQKAALQEARAGLTGAELDGVARSVLEEEGLASYFTHSLGHGLGLEIHEKPRVSRRSDEALPAGACVTIEPGVYMPEEEIGVRIEDIVVLEEGGCRNLTEASRELRVVGRRTASAPSDPE